MNKKMLFLPILLAPLLTGCGGTTNGVTIRIINSEDYIYLYTDNPNEDTETPEEEKMDLIDQFKIAMEEKYPEFGKINVIYTTTDTNESMYNEIQTGKAIYDLMCPSDYMIQKLITNDYLEKLDKDLIPHYFGEEAEVCQTLKDTLGNITATNIKSDPQTVERLEDYAVGYMWGTLGLLYNPDFNAFSEQAKEDIHDDVMMWDILWDYKYKGTSTIKNSMRDTYSVGIIETYKDELLAKRHDTDFNEYLTSIMNKCDKETVNKVKNTLDLLKNTFFGLECDSGKEDIVSGKIGINTAWSGDACFSMENAEEKDITLYYSVPDVGSNIWFDAWVVPKRLSGQAPRTEQESILVHEFLDFLCQPYVAKQNMAYTGYTSFVVGEEVRDLMRDWYDARTDYIYATEDDETYFDVYYVDENLEKVYLDYPDFELSEHLFRYDDCPLYYDTEEEEQISFCDPYLEDDVELTYGNILISYLLDDIHEGQISEVDLEYAFGGDPYNYLFYSSYYLQFEGNDCTGLEFYCQYPNIETVSRCAVMSYDHKNNENIVRMWEEFRSQPLPTWALILFIVLGTGIIGSAILVLISKKLRLRLRNKRKHENI